MENIRNSVSKTKRGLNKTNLEIMQEFTSSKRLRQSLNGLNEVEFIELAVRLEELKK